MHIFYGLVVSLIVFEVFVIQSDARDPVDKKQKGPAVDDVELPPELLGEILHRSGFKATKGAAQSIKLLPGAEEGMSRIFEDRILLINCNSEDDPGENHESSFKINGKFYFSFGNYKKLKSLFGKYGKHAKRILLSYELIDDISIRRDLNKNIVNKYAKQFTELYITSDDNGFWEEIMNENGTIRFPNVKKFSYEAPEDDRILDLNEIFPKLESVTLVGRSGGPNCLANVRNLKKLTLFNSAIEESQFKEIFKNNRGITRLNIVVEEKSTLHFVADYLKKLQTLKITIDNDEFLSEGSRVNLPLVSFFAVIIEETSQLKGCMSLIMPKLKRLKINGAQINNEMFQFIKHYGDLETVELAYISNDHYDLLGNLTNVKELNLSQFDCDRLSQLLGNFFKTNSETKSKLKSINLMCIYPVESEKSKVIMKEVNAQLIKSKKGTWTSTRNEDNHHHLIIKRNS